MFIDVHAHVYRTPYPHYINGKGAFPSPAELRKRQDELGIDRAVLLPIVSPEMYMPQANEEILQIAEESGGRWIPFCNIDPRSVTNTVDAPMDYYLRYYKDKGCKGIGEVMPNMAVSHPLMQNLFKHCQDVGMPLLFDLTGWPDFYGLIDDPGLPQLELSLRKFPKLIFIGHGPGFWSEIGKLETPADRIGYPRYRFEEEGVVPKLMRRYPSLYADLSAGSGYIAMTRNVDYTVKFLDEFQDRLMFGTDICFADQQVAMVEFLLTLRREKKISETVFQKLARQNAIALLGLT